MTGLPKPPFKHSGNYLVLENVKSFPLPKLLALLDVDRLTKLLPMSDQEHVKKYIVHRNIGLIACAYLCGSRVSEVCNVRIKDVLYDPPYLYINTDNLKSKDKKRKAVVIDIELEPEMVRLFMKFYKYRYNNHDSMDEALFRSVRDSDPNGRLGRKQVYNIITSYLGFHPHFLRKIRATHLLTNFKFTGQELVDYIGWKDINSSAPYILISAENIKNKFNEAKEKRKIDYERKEAQTQLAKQSQEATPRAAQETQERERDETEPVLQRELVTKYDQPQAQ